MLARSWRFVQRVLAHGLLLYWRFIKWIGGIILSFLIGTVVYNESYAYSTQKGQFDPIDVLHLPIVLLLEAHLIATVGALAIFAAVTLASFIAHTRTQATPQPAIRSEYTLQRVNRLDPAHYKLFRYLPHVYITREADEKARKLLHQLAAGPDTTLGICVVGLPAQGKTRLIWDAMQAELGDWTLVRWLHERQQSFDYAAQRGQRLVLWLDDLHEFANPNEATTINDLPRRFTEAGARLIVIATCRDGDNYTQAQKHLGSLLERLHIIPLENISAGEAVDLAKELTRAGVEVHGDEFDGTPGSLVLGVQRMTGRYLHLTSSAQQVLKTMKLLRSAKIYTYPEMRVRAVAREVFGLNEREWRKTCETLDQEHFIKVFMTLEEQRMLEPIADVYIEKVVADYPTQHMTLADEWPRLQACLMKMRDADGLNCLGVAFNKRLQGNQRLNQQHAIECYKSAQEVYTREQAPDDWAMTQNNLAAALGTQATLFEGEEQKHLLEEALEAYRQVLQVRTREQAPNQWAMTQNNLAVALYDQATLFDGEQQVRLLEEAIQVYRQALQVWTREYTPGDWAMTQCNLASALHNQASLLEGKEQKGLLEEVIQIYRLVLQVYTREYTPTDWARTQKNLAIALSEQARLLEGEDQKRLLEEAIQAYQNAAQVYTRQHAPERWRNTQLGIAAIYGQMSSLAESVEERNRWLHEAQRCADAVLSATLEGLRDAAMGSSRMIAKLLKDDGEVEGDDEEDDKDEGDRDEDGDGDEREKEEG